MTGEVRRTPVLERYYQRFLQDENSAAFIKQVAQQYTLPTLARLARFGSRATRRAATLALTYLGDFRVNTVLGQSLHDRDRGVRMIAENGISDVWLRDGNEELRQKLQVVRRLIRSRQYRDAVRLADGLIDEAPWFAELWHQRAIANFHLQRFNDAANDCQQTLEINPFHFLAAIGMARCYLEMNDIVGALVGFRKALKLNPNLDAIRAEVQILERSGEER